MKFDIGTVIRNDVCTQRYVVVDRDDFGNICVDALCAREGMRFIPYNFAEYYGSEDAYVIDDGSTFSCNPIVDDVYVEDYHLPKKWKYSEYKKSKKN